MQMNKILCLFISLFFIFGNNCNANDSVSFIIDQDLKLHVKCDGVEKTFDNISEDSLHEIRNITNKYFTFESIDIKRHKVKLKNFKSTLSGTYNFYIKRYDNVHSKVILDYKYNEPYVPKIHLENIERVNIKCKLAGGPKSGQINDIDLTKVYFNKKLMANYKDIVLNRHKNTIPKLLCGTITKCGNEIWNTLKIIYHTSCPEQIREMFKYE